MTESKGFAEFIDPCTRPPEDVPPIQVFFKDEEFLAAIKPGMELCTSDFTGWANIVAVDGGAAGGPSVVAERMTDGSRVRVPLRELIDIREGHCVRVDRVRATIEEQGWDDPA
ncbi:hypothetical protein VRY54_09375 [Actinomyces sp. F1_1611]